MGKGRLEAFSDGVLAIIITIMVLELRVPHGADARRLAPAGARCSSATCSASSISGSTGTTTTTCCMSPARVNGAILWANLHLLFWLSLVPFVTAWMGENHFASAPTALYGVVLLMAAIAYLILQRQILREEGPESILAAAVGRDTEGEAFDAALPRGYRRGIRKSPDCRWRVCAECPHMADS